jgi:hypothetical protein
MQQTIIPVSGLTEGLTPPVYGMSYYQCYMLFSRHFLIDCRRDPEDGGKIFYETYGVATYKTTVLIFSTIKTSNLMFSYQLALMKFYVRYVFYHRYVLTSLLLTPIS